MQVDFYHLTAAPLDRVLPQIAQKILAEGGRLLIVSGDEGQRAALDRSLWSWTPTSFLPHGCAGQDDDADQPVLIAGEVGAANGARHVALVDGVWREAALAFDRVFHFFDDEAIVAARGVWRELKARDDIRPRYWRQNDDGRWEQAA